MRWVLWKEGRCFFQPILHDFWLGDERLTHSLVVTRDSLPRLPSKSYEFHLSKSNMFNFRHFIPVKIILHSNYTIYLSIKRGHIYFHPSSNVRVTLLSISTVNFEVHILWFPKATRPPVVVRGVKPVLCRVSLTMSPTTSLLSLSTARVKQLFGFPLLKVISPTWLIDYPLTEVTPTPHKKFKESFGGIWGWSNMGSFSNARVSLSILASRYSNLSFWWSSSERALIWDR